MGICETHERSWRRSAHRDADLVVAFIHLINVVRVVHGDVCPLTQPDIFKPHPAQNRVTSHGNPTRVLVRVLDRKNIPFREEVLFLVTLRKRPLFTDSSDWTTFIDIMKMGIF